MKDLSHLVGRFFRSWRARRPRPSDQEFVAHTIDESLAVVFWRQPVPDLDHALRGAKWIASRAPDRSDLVRAFLLHDIGKRHSRLGTWGRSLTTAFALLRLPVGARGRTYLDHGAIGAAELEGLGADTLTVSFARHHAGRAPADVAPADWRLLVQADRR